MSLKHMKGIKKKGRMSIIDQLSKVKSDLFVFFFLSLLSSSTLFPYFPIGKGFLVVERKRKFLLPLIFDIKEGTLKEHQLLLHSMALLEDRLARKLDSSSKHSSRR